METSWHSYPKVYGFGHAAIRDLFTDPVIVEEKVDGSQFSFGRFDGELKARSKGQQLIIDAPEKMFSRAIDVISELDLHDGWTYRAEYLNKPKHNVLAYNRTPVQNLIGFDINTGEETYLSRSEKEVEFGRLGLEIVPVAYEGTISDASMFMSILDVESVLGGVTIEGIVVKNYARFGIDGKALMGKFVSEKFKEKHNKDWKDRHPQGKDIIQLIAEQYRHPMRWQKAIAHLRDAGTLKESPEDIGKLLTEIKEDVKSECQGEIADQLFDWAWPNIQRIIIAGFPQWYKEQLMQSQFEERGETA